MKLIQNYLLKEMKDGSKSPEIKKILQKTLAYSIGIDFYKKEICSEEKIKFIYDFFKREYLKYCPKLKLDSCPELLGIENILNAAQGNLESLAGKV